MAESIPVSEKIMNHLNYAVKLKFDELSSTAPQLAVRNGRVWIYAQNANTIVEKITNLISRIFIQLLALVRLVQINQSDAKGLLNYAATQINAPLAAETALKTEQETTLGELKATKLSLDKTKQELVDKGQALVSAQGATAKEKLRGDQLDKDLQAQKATNVDLTAKLADTAKKLETAGNALQLAQAKNINDLADTAKKVNDAGKALQLAQAQHINDLAEAQSKYDTLHIQAAALENKVKHLEAEVGTIDALRNEVPKFLELTTALTTETEAVQTKYLEQHKHRFIENDLKKAHLSAIAVKDHVETHLAPHLAKNETADKLSLTTHANSENGSNSSTSSTPV